MAGARQSANVEGVRRVKAIFVKEPLFVGSQRRYKYIRQPFNLIEYEWGNGERTTGLEPVLGNRFWGGKNGQQLTDAGTARVSGAPDWEEYDDLVIMDGYAELANWPTIYRDGSTAK